MKAVRDSTSGVIAAVRSLDVVAAGAILDAKRSLLTVTGSNDCNLLHLACAVRTTSATSRARNIELVRFLRQRGADVNTQDTKGRTALHIGLEKEFDPSLLTWFVRHGASPDVEEEGGTSARMKASRKRDKRYLAALR